MRYIIVDPVNLQRRASENDDPRWVYYAALLSSKSYEEYLSKAQLFSPVSPQTHGDGKKPITALAEYRYAHEKRG
ncbi:MAG: hypothetical protein BGP02_16375 [Pandoraea sp. 64-18]|nr:MAG: hypothetical protein BGP02_16375 [Pandoraea sp. 64-18]